MTTEVIIKSIEKVGSAFDQFRSDAMSRIETLEALADRPRGGTADGYSRDEKEHAELFAKWLRRPTEGSVKRALDDAQAAMETKAVTATVPSAGGYAVPTIIDRQIEERVRILNPFRSLVRVVQVGSRDFRALVSKNNTGSGWVNETATRTETTTSELMDRVPTFGTLYAYPKVTEEAMLDIFFNVQDWLVQEAADGFAAAEASAIVDGAGEGRPTGFIGTPVTTADDASPEREEGTLQYLPGLSGSPEALDADALIDLSLSIKEKYLLDPERVAWVMNRTTAAAVRKLKDSNGQYLWQPSLQAGQPATLLGYPVALTGAMPAPTAGEFPIAFGNWARGYILADRVGTMRITHDDNITTPGYHKFYIRRVVGGVILNHEAVKLIKYAAS